MTAIRNHTNLEKLNYQIEGIYFNQAHIAESLQNSNSPLKGYSYIGIEDREDFFKTRLKNPLRINPVSPHRLDHQPHNCRSLDHYRQVR